MLCSSGKIVNLNIKKILDLNLKSSKGRGEQVTCFNYKDVRAKALQGKSHRALTLSVLLRCIDVCAFCGIKTQMEPILFVLNSLCSIRHFRLRFFLATMTRNTLVWMGLSEKKNLMIPFSLFRPLHTCRFWSQCSFFLFSTEKWSLCEIKRESGEIKPVV